jgi:hypothetical protein
MILAAFESSLDTVILPQDCGMSYLLPLKIRLCLNGNQLTRPVDMLSK